MLDNIKSFKNIKDIFAYVEEIKKLEIVKYNKSLQNKISINILNYKVFSGRYIIYEKNGYGKEYDAYTDKLIFEGEYLHGKRKVNGKEYIKEYNNYQDNLIYKGEYLNGQKNGKGILI